MKGFKETARTKTKEEQSRSSVTQPAEQKNDGYMSEGLREKGGRQQQRFGGCEQDELREGGDC